MYTPRLNQEKLALLTTDKDVASYEEHGWYISKKVIPDEMIDTSVLASEKFYRGEQNVKLPCSNGYNNWKPGDGDAIRNNEFVSLQNNVFRQFALQPISR